LNKKNPPLTYIYISTNADETDFFIPRPPLLPGYLRGYGSQVCLPAVTKEEIYYVESKRISTVENL
jgi:hypothetical protein